MSLELSGTTGVKGVAGSVSAPSIVGDDTNTGISFPSADTIKFSTGGVERMSITNSGITGITAGITMADTWRLVTQYINEQNTLGGTSDWERDDTYGNGLLGTGMSQANGYFTFPSTGFYSVRFYGHHSMSYSNGRSITGKLVYTANNFSSSENAAYYTVNCTGDSGAIIHGSGSLEKIFDITDVSNQKVKFAVGYAQNGSAGRTTVDTNANKTYAIFVRLGDT